MYKTKLMKDVGISTMYEMRDQGLTNREIAERLGVSEKTIYNHIGSKNPRSKRNNKSHKMDDDRHTETFADVNEAGMSETVLAAEKTAMLNDRNAAPSQLRLVSSRSVFQGSMCKYTVDTGADSIEISGDVFNGLLDKTTLNELIIELNEIMEML